MSKTMVVAPIMGALVGAEEILGRDRKWNSVNDTQAHFLEKYFSTRAELSRYSEKELRHWVSWVAAELNEILKKEGFDIQLQDFREGEFGVVSILDVLVEWLVKGKKAQLLVDGTHYPAVRIEESGTVEGEYQYLFEAYTSSQHPHPIAVLHTKSGDKVYLTIADKAYQDFELISRIDKIRNDLRHGPRYVSLMFPMVELNHEVDIGWLKQMWTIDENSGQKAFISQALQQTKFKMNETGARVKSAVAVGITLTSARPEQPLIIDKPFFLWIERKDISIPVMYAYINQEDWKDPGNLDM